MTFFLHKSTIETFRKAGRPHASFFIVGGYSDTDAGGWTLKEMAKNRRSCLREKTEKISMALTC